VKDDTYISLGTPRVGSEISERDLGTLRFDNDLIKTYRKALSLIADVDRSRRELRMKLLRSGYPAEVIDIVLDQCELNGYLDEERHLERLIEREANQKLRGRYYIRRKLAAKGYRTSLIDRVTDMLVERGEIDFEVNLERLAEKRGVSEESELTALAYRYGYEI
jgi:SOS response regulatory protein OraA/RecX